MTVEIQQSIQADEPTGATALPSHVPTPIGPFHARRWRTVAGVVMGVCALSGASLAAVAACILELETGARMRKVASTASLADDDALDRRNHA